MKILTKKEKELLRPIFWDTDINNLDLDKHRGYTIERILQFGRSEHLKWLLRKFNQNDIIETVRNSSNIDRRTANFWSLLYKIPREEVKCFQKPLVPGIPDYWR